MKLLNKKEIRKIILRNFKVTKEWDLERPEEHSISYSVEHPRFFELRIYLTENNGWLPGYIYYFEHGDSLLQGKNLGSIKEYEWNTEIKEMLKE
jgi:hypothetical protein